MKQRHCTEVCARDTCAVGPSWVLCILSRRICTTGAYICQRRQRRRGRRLCWALLWDVRRMLLLNYCIWVF